MSLNNIFVVARIRNASAHLCVNNNNPKTIARYIDDNNIYSVLLNTTPNEGLRTVAVGVSGMDGNTQTCIMVGVSKPVEQKVTYDNIIKNFDEALCPVDNDRLKGKMFWSNDVTYIIIDEAYNHAQVEWWSQFIKEMEHSYHIEESR
jgi:hypothetical protein